MLDTSICIDMIRGNAPAATSRLRSRAPGEVGLSMITLAELEHGVAKSSDPPGNAAALIKFCTALEVLPFDDRAASVYGRVRADLERAGKPIGPLDTLIAAHALSLGATLVTGNVREFRRITALVVKDWTQP